MTGSIVTFDDAIPFMPIEKLVAQIEPQQDLHGYDAPWAAGAGKNLFDQDTCTIGKYIAEGGNIADWTTAEYSDYIAVTAGQQYIFSGTNKTGAQSTTRIHGYNSSKAWVQQITTETVAADAKWNTTFTVPEGISFVRVSTGYPLPDGQLEKGSTATSYAPYANECPITGWTGLSGWVEDEYDPTEQPTFSVTWQTEAGTVYGGTVDVVSGLLTADMGIKTELWKNFTSETATGSTLIRRQVSIASAQGSFANKERTISNVAPFDATIARETVHVSMASSGNYLYAILPTTTDPDLEITFCYPLATPQTYQLTGQQIETLLGQNTVWVDTGDISVTYQSTSGSTPTRTSLKSPLKSYSYNALKMFGNTFIEHGKG